MNLISKISWKFKKNRVAVILILATVASLLLLTLQHQRKSDIHEISKASLGCDFPAIFNFGDSNSDTGAASAAFGRLESPYGETFFGRPNGRYSDGRLMIDFFAEKLGLPYVSAYLDSMGSNFTTGANFAASGSTIKPQAIMSPLDLGKQLSQFDQFKARSIELHNNGGKGSDGSSFVQSILPKIEYFRKALYTMDTGQNDLHYVLTMKVEDEARKYILSIIDQFSSSVETLYEHGARAFWIHNTGPIGCLPFFTRNYPEKPENMDPVGCIKSYNDVAREFNSQLKDKVFQLRDRFKDAFLVYVDIYTVKYSLISKAEEHGFIDPLGYCCHGQGADCWEKALLNGTKVDKASCEKPSQYISWDSIHYTESANHWVANQIMDGSFSDPTVPISQACQWFVQK